MTSQAYDVCANEIRDFLYSTGVADRPKLSDATTAGPQFRPRGPDMGGLDLDLDDAARCAAGLSEILASWGAPPDVLRAAQLHKIVHKLGIDADSLIRHCSSYTAFLCSEYARIFSDRMIERGRGRATARCRVQLYHAVYADPALGLIMAAEAWRQFTQVRNHAGSSHHYSEQARHVVRPYLEMLGLQALREELDQWLWLSQGPASDRAAAVNQSTFDAIEQQLRAHVEEHLPSCAIRYHNFSLANGAHSRSVNDQLARAGQVVDIALLVATETECYQALGLLHNLFQPIEGALSDHLRDGRLNGLRTLQTGTMTTQSGHRLRLNFHISTYDMDHINRWGLAAFHFQNQQPHLPNAWWTDAQTGASRIDSALAGELPEILYVFSPQGQIFRFYRGATVVDYAYHVHTDLAHQCYRFYINDESVEPTTPLHHLDLVALEHDPYAPGPTQIWLGAARTSKARSSIERFLKRRGLGVDQGQRILDQERADLEAHFGFNMPDHRIAQASVLAVRRLKVGRTEDLLTEIAAGRISATQILYPLFAEEVIRQIRLPRGMGIRPHQVHLAQCCRPRVADNIVGLPSFRHGKISRLRVHITTCNRIAAELDGAVELTWRLQPSVKTVAQLEVVAHDEDGLLGDAVRQVYSRLPYVALHKVEAQAQHGIARISFFVEATSNAVVDELVADLRALPDRQVAEVRKLRLPPSEIEASVQATGRATPARVFNPYSRLPVSVQNMFFGRTQELDTIAAWLHADVSNIWLLGQKRVGKTSVLLHLKHNYLAQQGFAPVFIDFQLLGNLATANLFFEIANAVYAELQNEPSIGQSGPPLRSLFEHQPPIQLIRYLHDISERLAPRRLVLLMDEFSRTSDAYLQGQVNRSFFEAWRGLLQSTVPAVSYITVIQQQTHDSLAQRAQHDRNDPCWHLMELGEKIVLKGLDGPSVRRLIEWPMRNFLEYTPESVDTIASQTGGDPFLIQAFCFKLAAHMADQDRRQVTPHDIKVVCQEFMLPTESVFTHFLDMIRGIGNQVSQQFAHLAQQHEEGNVSFVDLSAQLPSIPAASLRRALQELTRLDILVPLPSEQWRFASRLFQQWLHLNAV